MSGVEMEQCDIPDVLAMLSYLSQVYDTFRREIPHIKHPKLVYKIIYYVKYIELIMLICVNINYRKTVIMDLHQQKVVLKLLLLKIIHLLHIQKLLH